MSERSARYALVLISLVGLAAGLAAWLAGKDALAYWAWALGTAPVIVALAVAIVRDLLAGRMGVDAVAFVSMSAALALGEALAGVVVAVMYAGGNVLEQIAVARAERDLRSLVDRAPRIAHRRLDNHIEDIAIETVTIGDILLVRAGEVVPVDGAVVSGEALIDELALTGEPLPVLRRAHEPVRSGTVNAGETFAMRATATAGESTYAGIVRLVTAAQTAKAPFIRIADRYALLLLPATLFVAGAAYVWSGDPIRALAVLVASTPCPLILAAPVAFIAGVSQAARHGVLVKGGGALEALARTHTVMFDKTGTLTVGGARLVAIETAPGENAETVLQGRCVLGTRLAPYCRRSGRRRSHCAGPRPCRPRGRARNARLRPRGNGRGAESVRRRAGTRVRNGPAAGMGDAGAAARLLAGGAERLRSGRWPRHWRAPACR